MTPVCTRGIVAALGLASFACLDDVSLGEAPYTAPPPSPSPACAPNLGLETYAEVGAEYGPIRAMKAGADALFVVASPENMPATMLRVKPDSVTAIGTIGPGPDVSMALDAASVYVTSPKSSQVFRVAQDGRTSESILQQANPRAIVATARSGGAYWAVDGGIAFYNFDTNVNAAPPEGGPGVTALAHDGLRLFASRGEGPIDTVYGFPQMERSTVCDGRMLVLTDSSLLCAQGGTIHQLPRDPTGYSTSRATLQGTVFDLVAGAGRAFFRFEGNNGGSPRIMSFPLGNRVQPTVVSSLPGQGRFLTMDRCHLYLAVDNSIRRWAL